MNFKYMPELQWASELWAKVGDGMKG